MLVIKEILYGIESDCHLGPQMDRDPAIGALVKEYKDLVLKGPLQVSPQHYAATGETYGEDFKKYLSFLPSHDQLRLLESFLEKHPRPVAQPRMKPEEGILVEESEEEQKDEDEESDEKRHMRRRSTDKEEAARDERRQRMWFAKAGFILVAMILCIVLGAVTVMMVHNKTLPDNELIAELMKSAVEIIKVLFSMK